MLGVGTDNAAAVLLNVNDGPTPLQIGGNFNRLKSHYVMHCLDGDLAGQTHVDDTDGAVRRIGRPWHGTIAAFIVGLNDVIRGGSCCCCRRTHPFFVGERMQVMWDHCWNDRR